MAATILGFLIDTPDYKEFDIDIGEVDAINQPNVLTFAGAGMTNFRAVPQIWWWEEITPFAAGPLGNCTIAIHTPTAAQIEVFKPCPAIAPPNGVRHTFRVWMSTITEWQV